MSAALNPAVTAFLAERGLLRERVHQSEPGQLLDGAAYRLPNGDNVVVVRRQGAFWLLHHVFATHVVRVADGALLRRTEVLSPDSPLAVTDWTVADMTPVSPAATPTAP